MLSRSLFITVLFSLFAQHFAVAQEFPSKPIQLIVPFAGVKMLAVPYKGSPPAVADLLGGLVDVMFDPASMMAPLVKAGKVRGLAVTTAGRSSIAPNVPSAREVGLPELESSTWYGIVAPAGTPKDIVARLNREIAKALRAPDVMELFATQGIESSPSSPARLGEYIASEIDRWREVARDAGIKPE